MDIETKICTQCGRKLPVTEFHWRNKAKGTRRSECRECHNRYMSNKNAENRMAIQQLKKAVCCAKCGEQRWYLLDYHHIDPTSKKDKVSELMLHSSLKDALNEIDKCIPLCANCHREFHYLNRETGITLEEYLQ